MRTSGLAPALVAVSLSLAPFAVVACGAPPPAARVANVKSAAMPSGAVWTGVYFNPQFGNLHLVEKGGSVNGRWKAAGGQSWGELNGKVEGNVLKFEWRETRIGMVGPSAVTRGKGVFVYSRPEGENVDDELAGQWGLGDSETGNAWDCKKQRNVTAEPNSIGGQREVGGPGGWE